MVNSYLWPDVKLRQVGLFAEYLGEWTAASRYTLGLRYDAVEAEANKAASQPVMLSPNQLYTLYYGKTADTHDEDNLSALLRLG